MAGEWIKVRTNLWDDPRVSQLCDMTGAQEATIVGGLYWLWATADEHTETGLMPGLSAIAVDRKTGIRGFGAALVSIGWIEDTPDGIMLVRFDEHNGASAKSRAQTAKRVANHKGNAKVTVPALPERYPSVSDALPREDKIREEVKPSPIAPKGGKPSKASSIGFPAFLARCKSEGETPIPDDHPVFAYAEEAQIPRDFLALHWFEFKDRYGDGTKKYKDWRKVFSNSVRGNWFRLWYAPKDGGQYQLTTDGVQAQNVHRDKMK